MPPVNALIGICLWLLAANVIAMIPSRKHHWPQAYVLIAIGLPLLVWVYVENGLLIALVSAIACGSMLRWPMIYLGRWIKRQVTGKGAS